MYDKMPRQGMMIFLFFSICHLVYPVLSGLYTINFRLLIFPSLLVIVIMIIPFAVAGSEKTVERCNSPPAMRIPSWL